MEIWTIEDGEKRGPFHDFEVRRRIASGELGTDTPAWHDGLEVWTVLGEIPAFSREFEKPVPEVAVAPPPLPPEAVAQASYLRRFWARWFDLIGFSALWWFGMWLAGRDIKAILDSPWIMLFQLVPWFLIEAWMIHSRGRTPGKWLLGIRVVNDDGSALTLAESTRRSVRVMFLGVGFGWGAVALVCQAMSLFFARRLGRPLWDQAGGHRSESEPLSSPKLLVFMAAFAGLLMLQWTVLAPFVIEETIRRYPETREMYEKNPFSKFHLPVGGPGGD